MLSQNIAASKQGNQDEGHESTGGGGRKTSSLRPPDQILKCPRCDSPNTKFCYYNNYSLAQPRHFCKACRRYWTNGGALRNVPVGGSCRKNKKISSRFFLAGDSTAKGSSNSDIGGMKFYGLSPIDFQLNLPPPRVVTTTNQLISSSSNPNSFDPLGFNFPFPSSPHNIVVKQGDHHHHHQTYQSGGLTSFHELRLHQNTSTDIASSIESLSSINQDLHWKLQQQRLAAMMYGSGDNDQQQQKKQAVVEPPPPAAAAAQKLQPILFQNLETSKPAAAHESSSMDGGSTGLATEWFFDNSLNLNPSSSTPTNSSSAGNNNDQNGISINNWNGVQAWNHFS